MVQPVVRPLGYTGFLQQLVWDQGDNVFFRAYLFGGGGGCGGTSYQAGWTPSTVNSIVTGGSGQGGGYAYYEGYVDEGDVLWCAVGGGGGGGGFGMSNSPGLAGKSYIYEVTAPPVALVQQIPLVPGALPAEGTPGYTGTGFYTVTVAASNNPVDKLVQWWFVVQNGTITYKSYVRPPYNYSGGTYRGSIQSYSPSYPRDSTTGICSVNAFDLQGNFTGQSSFSGARGGWAGSNWSGAAGTQSCAPGGGGGGATVFMKNSTILAVAGGGGGGGGGGNPAVNPNAPGSTTSPYPTTNGQNGPNSTSNNAGGGGGGGGWGGGDGGHVGGFAYSSSNAYGGNPGGCYGLSYINSLGITSAGSSQPYWSTLGKSSVGNGGVPSTPRSLSVGTQTSIPALSGTAGMAIFEFYPIGMHVKQGSSWTPVQQTWIKANDSWQRPTAIYIKQDDEWKLVWGSYAPNWVGLVGSFGDLSRPWNEADPQEPPHDGGGEYVGPGGVGDDQGGAGAGGGADGGDGDDDDA